MANGPFMDYRGRVEAGPEPKIDLLPAGDEAMLNARRQRKFLTFVVFEGVALAVLIPSLVFGMVRRFADPTLALSMNVVTIAAAAAVAILPILFYAIASPIPRGER